MTLTVHGLLEQKELTQNYPQYRHYIKCKCGFEARLATKTAVETQFDAHLLYHGQEPYFSSLKKEETKEVKKTEESTTGSENGSSTTTPSSGGLRTLGGQIKST